MKTILAIFLALAGAVSTQAASLLVPNGDFETIPPDPNLDGDNNYRTGDISPPWNNDTGFGGTAEKFTNPSTYHSGWQLNTPNIGVMGSGRYGLQQPRSDTGANQYFYQRSLPPGSNPNGALVAPFNGNFIGFVNMDDVDGFQHSIQSGVISTLEEGTYSLTVAFGARAGANWNDVKYGISLVSDPLSTGGLGTAGGNVLGTPASLTLVPFGSTVGNNVQDLTYALTLGAGDPNLGKEFAIRIDTENTGFQNGVADPGHPLHGGTNARFTQGNWDNARLEFTPVPEPGTIALLGLGAAVLGLLRFRRSA